MAHRYFEDKEHVQLYRKYRPLPPQELCDYVVEYTKAKCSNLETAVDVGCGSGQGTFAYSPYFNKVYGFDVSPNQVEEADKANCCANVSFQVSPAETLPFADESVQLVTAATAAHWFDLEKFFNEAYRVLQPGGVIAIYTMWLPEYKWSKNPTKDAMLNKLSNDFNSGPVRPVVKYLPPPGWMVINKYRDINFPSLFVDAVRDETTFYQDMEYSLADAVNEYSTWSAFQLLKKEEGQETANKILDNLTSEFLNILGDDLKDISPPHTENVKITVRYGFVLLMARKPVS